MHAGGLPVGFTTRWRFVLCALVLAAMTGGCAGWTNPGGWFGKEQPETSSRGPLPYYTSQPGMKLYTEPSFSSAHIAVLPLYQKVHRSRVDRGFAYVEVEGSGQRGWVDNARLIWRLPTTAAQKIAPAAPASDQKPAPVGSVANPTSVTDDSTPAQPSVAPGPPAAAPAENASSDTTQPEEPATADPSSFSPF